jgi:hypothetical protein
MREKERGRGPKMVNLGHLSAVFNTQCALIYNKRGKWRCVFKGSCEARNEKA